MKLLTLLIPLTLFLSISIDKKYEGYENLQSEDLKVTAPDTVRTLNGELLIKKYCYTCHSPEMRGNQRLAPPFQMVKMHYLREHSTKEQFADAISAWVSAPSEEKSIMPGALARFGPMPPMMIHEEELRQIALYLYENDLPEFRGRGYGPMHRRHGRGNGRM